MIQQNVYDLQYLSNRLQVVVIMTLWLLTMLSGYMGFLMCLDPLINKRKVKFYQESGAGTEEVRRGKRSNIHVNYK